MLKENLVRTFEPGTKVRIRGEAFNDFERAHLRLHARQGDVGIIQERGRRAGSIASLYTIVAFEQCGKEHRLNPDEIEVVAPRTQKSR